MDAETRRRFPESGSGGAAEGSDLRFQISDLKSRPFCPFCPSNQSLATSATSGVPTSRRSGAPLTALRFGVFVAGVARRGHKVVVEIAGFQRPRIASHHGGDIVFATTQIG